MGTKTILNFGYNHYVLPDSIKIDAIKDIVDSIKINSEYHAGKKWWHKERVTEVELFIVSEKDFIDGFLNTMNDENNNDEFRKFVMESTMEKANKNHLDVIFKDTYILIGGSTTNWPEDIADPGFDPEEFIVDLINKINNL